jgi:hypothetical protein
VRSLPVQSMHTFREMGMAEAAPGVVGVVPEWTELALTWEE